MLVQLFKILKMDLKPKQIRRDTYQRKTPPWSFCNSKHYASNREAQIFIKKQFKLKSHIEP